MFVHMSNYGRLVYTDTSNAHSVQRYMFSLRVRDDTAFADVIVYGKVIFNFSLNFSHN